MPCYLVRPGSLQRLPALVFVFEIFGFTSEMKRVADDFADAGYVVLMPDLFSRGSWFSCVRSLMKDIQRGEGTGVEDLIAARGWLSTREYVVPSQLGIIGFCMGGAFALILSNKGLFRVAAPFYGKTPERLDGACPIVASYGGRDKIMLPEVAKIEAETKRLNIPSDIKTYPEAGHGFMNKAPNPLLGFLTGILPIHAGYDPAAAADAKKRVVNFLRTHL
jgi:carboxymethylenebutenolidase